MSAPRSLDGRITDLVEQAAARTDTVEVKFAVGSPLLGEDLVWAEPGSRPQHFIASTTKLFALAVALRLHERGALTLGTRAIDILPAATLRGLNTYGGTDHAAEYTAEQLLAHTTGIPDYFEGKTASAQSFIERMAAADFGWTLDDVLEQARRGKAGFAPGDAKAVYSDTNYQLLGAMIETVCGKPFADVLRDEVLDPLGLADTYMFTSATLDQYDTISPFLLGAGQLRIPLAMASVGVDGGVVSTTTDCLRFLRAFAGGELFSAASLAAVTARWRRIFPPLQYGVGIMKFELPALLTGFRKVPPMLGHSGASGHVLFWNPERQLFIAGTVNQVAKRSLAYQVMTKVAILCR
jgi:CubicO group peptidase (beta-lactamase class C family)